MAYNKTQSYQELENETESVAFSLLSALRKGEDFFTKVVSWSDNRTDAELAAYLWARDNTLNKSLFNNSVLELEAVISDIRALAIAVNGITSGLTADQLDALTMFS